MGEVVLGTKEQREGSSLLGLLVFQNLPFTVLCLAKNLNEIIFPVQLMSSTHTLHKHVCTDTHVCMFPQVEF